MSNYIRQDLWEVSETLVMNVVAFRPFTVLVFFHIKPNPKAIKMREPVGFARSKVICSLSDLKKDSYHSDSGSHYSIWEIPFFNQSSSSLTGRPFNPWVYLYMSIFICNFLYHAPHKCIYTFFFNLKGYALISVAQVLCKKQCVFSRSNMPPMYWEWGTQPCFSSGISYGILNKLLVHSWPVVSWLIKWRNWIWLIPKILSRVNIHWPRETEVMQWSCLAKKQCIRKDV